MPFRADGGEILRLATKLEGVSKNFARDSARVLGTTQRGMRTEASKSAGAVYNVGRNRLSDKSKGWQITNVDKTALSFVIRGLHKPLTLMSYGAKQVGTGLAFKIFRGSPKTIRGGFIAKNLPWRRTTKKRLPIEVKRGPSMADMLNNPKVIEPLGAAFVTRATKELQRLIDRAFRG